jgi:hypothetical protein
VSTLGRKLVQGDVDFIEAPPLEDTGQDDGIDYRKLKAHNCEFLGEDR